MQNEKQEQTEQTDETDETAALLADLGQWQTDPTPKQTPGPLQLKRVNKDKRRTAEEERERIERKECQERERETATAETERAISAIMAKRPPGAAALIVAELEEDDSDSMTDYYATRTTRTVAIGWRTGQREDFRQLRRTAATYPDTAHLGPGCDRWTGYVQDWGVPIGPFPTEAELQAAAAVEIETSTSWGIRARDGWKPHHESVEHRDNYSMGAGNYLKSGGRYSSGWTVRSRAIGDDGRAPWLPGDVEDGLPVPGGAGQGTGQPVPTGEPGAWSVSVQRNKRGPFALVELAERVERPEFERLRDLAKAVGGWYSRAWKGAPGGFGFADEASATAWANAVLGARPGGEHEPTTVDGTLPDPRGPRPLEDRPAPPRGREDRECNRCGATFRAKRDGDTVVCGTCQVEHDLAGDEPGEDYYEPDPEREGQDRYLRELDPGDDEPDPRAPAAHLSSRAYMTRWTGRPEDIDDPVQEVTWAHLLEYMRQATRFDVLPFAHPSGLEVLIRFDGGPVLMLTDNGGEVNVSPLERDELPTSIPTSWCSGARFDAWEVLRSIAWAAGRPGCGGDVEFPLPLGQSPLDPGEDPDDDEPDEDSGPPRDARTDREGVQR